MMRHVYSWTHEYSWCVMSTRDAPWERMKHHKCSWCFMRAHDAPWEHAWAHNRVLCQGSFWGNQGLPWIILGACGYYQGSFRGESEITEDYFGGKHRWPRFIFVAIREHQRLFWGQSKFIWMQICDDQKKEESKLSSKQTQISARGVRRGVVPQDIQFVKDIRGARGYPSASFESKATSLKSCSLTTVPALTKDETLTCFVSEVDLQCSIFFVFFETCLDNLCGEISRK